MWHELKEYIRKKMKPQTTNEVMVGIKAFWTTVTVSKCAIYIGYLKNVIPAVIPNNGDATGY